MTPMEHQIGSVDNMTREEYLKRLKEAESEEQGSDWLKTGKHIAKHMAVSIPGAAAMAYLTGGGEAVPGALIAGPLSGLVTGIATEDDDDSIVAPVGVSLGLGAAVGAKNTIDKQALKMQEMKKNKTSNMNYSDVKEFFSSYSPEGLKNFSEKLRNFALTSPLGAISGYMAAPEDEEYEYMTRSAFGAGTGGFMGAIPAAASGATAGGLLGGVFGSVPDAYKSSPGDGFLTRGKNWAFRKGGNARARVANAIAGTVFGGTAAGGVGLALGSKEGSNAQIEDLKRRKRKEMIARRLMIESLSDEEKAKIGRLIREKRKEKGLKLAEDYVNKINKYNFSLEENQISNFAWGTVVKLTFKQAVEAFNSVIGDKLPKGTTRQAAFNKFLKDNKIELTSETKLAREAAEQEAKIAKNAQKDAHRAKLEEIKAGKPESTVSKWTKGTAVVGATGLGVAHIGGLNDVVPDVIYGVEERETRGSNNRESNNANTGTGSTSGNTTDWGEIMKGPGVSAAGGAIIGAIAGGDSDPIMSGITGAGIGGISHYLAEEGGMDKSKAMAIGLGASALGSFILSRLNKKGEDKDKKKKKEKKSFFESEKKGPGRPKKESSVLDSEISKEDLRAFESML